MRLRVAALIGSMGLLAAGPVCAGKPKNPQPTIGDLTGRQVEVQTNKPVDAGANRAMENYREFLNLKSNDPALRAEAMRRLGDLNLEASEIERGEREQTSADALQSGEAIKLYTTLLESYPDYRQSDGVLYQLARA